MKPIEAPRIAVGAQWKKLQSGYGETSIEWKVKRARSGEGKEREAKSKADEEVKTQGKTYLNNRDVKIQKTSSKLDKRAKPDFKKERNPKIERGTDKAIKIGSGQKPVLTTELIIAHVPRTWKWLEIGAIFNFSLVRLNGDQMPLKLKFQRSELGIAYDNTERLETAIMVAKLSQPRATQKS